MIVLPNLRRLFGVQHIQYKGGKNTRIKVIVTAWVDSAISAIPYTCSQYHDVY